MSVDNTSQEVSQKKRKRVKPERPTVEPIPEVTGDGNSKFARALGSSDWQTREKGLQALTRWLSLRQEFDENDMKKIWKGLFYAFWHSDKGPVQAKLAERLAAILPQLNSEVAFSYFTVCMQSLRREWFGIDRLRLDKFMLLIRHFLRQLFQHLSNLNWTESEVDRYCNFLAEHVLVPSDTYAALGVTYHVIDCWLPELHAAAEEAPPEVLAQLLAPAVHCLACTPTAACIARLTDSIFGPLIASDDELTFEHLDVEGLAQELFAIGAMTSTKAKNREALYALSKKLLKSRRKRAKTAAAEGPSPTVEATATAEKAEEAAPTPHSSAGSPAETAEAPESNGVASAAASGIKKKKKKQKGKAEGVLPLEALQPVEPLEQVSEVSGPAAPASHPAESIGVADPVTATAADSAVAQKLLQKPKSAKKLKREAAAAAAATGLGPSSGAPAESMSEGGAHLADGVVGTPGRADKGGGIPEAALRALQAATAGTPDSEARKSVRFHLRSNLYFDFGGKVPPPDVRTPPKAKPKGSALKVQQAATERKTSRMRLQPKSPKSLPRAKAAAFF